jgi:hypothetical protein
MARGPRPGELVTDAALAWFKDFPARADDPTIQS